ncbi:MAG: hypothetical protein ABIK07_10855 [Planctomycetota bacterium]
MFQRNIFQGIFIIILFSVILQDGLLYAQGGELESISSQLNRDSFIVCREIQTKFQGIRGQRSLITKAYEIHAMADNIHRMLILNVPVRGMDRALDDLSLLVDDLDQSIKAMRAPVLRDPVTIPTGPNGYRFYGGNGYPQPSFQYNGFPYRMVAERTTSGLCQTLQEMRSSISQLQRYFAPLPPVAPVRRSFPVPNSVPPSGSDRGAPPQPSGFPEPLPEENDSRWQPSRGSAPVYPPAPPARPSIPAQQGPEFLPPLPSAN